MPSDKSKQIDLEEFKNSNPEEYEKKYVHETYEKIASHFSATRHHPWPKIKSFLETLPETSTMIDVGCGNGKNLGISPGINFGCDICHNLLEIARSRGHNVVQCDALNLSYDDEMADVVISIAVIHHFTTHERRLKAIQEMFRILKVGGQILIYVWAKNQSQQSNDVFVGWERNYKRENGQDSDEIHQRYYHFFDEGELDQLCLQVNNCVIEKSYFDKENWAVIVRKI